MLHGIAIYDLDEKQVQKVESAQVSATTGLFGVMISKN